MGSASLITPAGVRARVDVSSKKRLLEMVAETAAASRAGLDARTLFDALLSRERLGSTALGHGVAIPHCRYSACTAPIGVVITLAEPIAFDAPDDAPVDILIALLVPEEANHAHLELLATLAAALEKETFRDRLRAANSDDALYESMRSLDEVAHSSAS